MSSYTKDLPNRVVQDWRRFAGQSSFQYGIEWLRHNAAPAIRGETPIEKFECAIAWHAYQKALNDIEERLTQSLPEPQSLDEPSIHQPK